jgi:hypothetical protein
VCVGGGGGRGGRCVVVVVVGGGHHMSTPYPPAPSPGCVCEGGLCGGGESFTRTLYHIPPQDLVIPAAKGPSHYLKSPLLNHMPYTR